MGKLFRYPYAPQAEGSNLVPVNVHWMVRDSLKPGPPSLINEVIQMARALRHKAEKKAVHLRVIPWEGRVHRALEGVPDTYKEGCGFIVLHVEFYEDREGEGKKVWVSSVEWKT